MTHTGSVTTSQSIVSHARSKAITLKDVAARAGVGPMSVSVVLNGTQSPTRVSESTRRRIVQAASELGYRRNLSAAAARSGRYGNIAFVMSSQTNRTFLREELLISINEELALHDLLLTMVQLPDERLTDVDFMPNILRKLSCDGVVIDYVSMIPNPLIELIERHGIPAVWLNVERPTDSVFPLDEQAAFDATMHLLELGHRKILHVTSSSSGHESVANRRRGYELAMHGAAAPSWVEAVSPKDDPGPLFERMQGWFLSGNAPTAIFAYEADYAIPVWLVAEKMGKAVPRDVSIIAIHDREVRLLGRQLTCWEIPVFGMGRESVRMLLRKIQYPTAKCESIRVPFGVKAGQTCCAPTR